MDPTAYAVKGLTGPVATGVALFVFHIIIKYLKFTGIGKFLYADSGLLENRKKPLLQSPTFYPIPEKADPGATPCSVNDVPDYTQVTNHALIANRKGFRFVTAADYHQAYKEGKTTPLAVAKELVEIIRKSNTSQSPKLLAIIKCDQDEVLRLATESTERYKCGKFLSPLDGVPISVKDEMDLLPYQTGLGTSFIKIQPEKHAFIVGKLAKAGALFIGKANMHEIGIDITNCNPNTGTPRNPYNLNHFTGGSSGGSAASVASGLCPISIGADGGGSIRIPSSLCGVYGLKPTAFRLAPAGSFPLAPTVGVSGPIAATAADLALAYLTIAGPDPECALTLRQPKPTALSFGKIKDLKDIRIGIYDSYFNHSDAIVVEACREFIKKLEARGAKIVQINLPFLEELRVSHVNTIISEMLAGTAGLDRTKFAYATQATLNVAEQNLGPRDYIDAAKFRTLGMDMLTKVFEKVDLIVTPSTACTAPSIPEGALSMGISDITSAGKIMRYVFLCNFLGIPGLSVPIAYDDKGLPIGFQFMAKWWQEDLLLRMAHVSEDITADDRKEPKLYYRSL